MDAAFCEMTATPAILLLFYELEDVTLCRSCRSKFYETDPASVIERIQLREITLPTLFGYEILNTLRVLAP